MRKIRESVPFRALRLTVVNAFNHKLGKNAAALAYYLLFAIFPLLIFISNLLGVLELNVSVIVSVLGRILPLAAVELIESYLEHISNNSTEALLWFSLVFSVWFPMRAVRGLMDDVRRAYGAGLPCKPLMYLLRQFLCTLVFLVAIAVTLVLSVTGENVLNYIAQRLSQSTEGFAAFVLRAWHYLRFSVIGLLMFSAIGVLYSVALEKREPLRRILPGMLLAEVSWMIVSVCFSFYAENFADYSVIYGALGAVMVLLVWLYLTAMILILGAEFNAALSTLHSQKGKTLKDEMAEIVNRGY